MYKKACQRNKNENRFLLFLAKSTIDTALLCITRLENRLQKDERKKLSHRDSQRALDAMQLAYSHKLFPHKKLTELMAYLKSVLHDDFHLQDKKKLRVVLNIKKLEKRSQRSERKKLSDKNSQKALKDIELAFNYKLFSNKKLMELMNFLRFVLHHDVNFESKFNRLYKMLNFPLKNVPSKASQCDHSNDLLSATKEVLPVSVIKAKANEVQRLFLDAELSVENAIEKLQVLKNKMLAQAEEQSKSSDYKKVNKHLNSLSIELDFVKEERSSPSSSSSNNNFRSYKYIEEYENLKMMPLNRKIEGGFFQRGLKEKKELYQDLFKWSKNLLNYFQPYREGELNQMVKKLYDNLNHDEYINALGFIGEVKRNSGIDIDYKKCCDELSQIFTGHPIFVARENTNNCDCKNFTKISKLYQNLSLQIQSLVKVIQSILDIEMPSCVEKEVFDSVCVKSLDDLLLDAKKVLNENSFKKFKKMVDKAQFHAIELLHSSRYLDLIDQLSEQQSAPSI